jgi:tripartite-type tricarboxylate transporter receptor subunit TctC
MQLSRRQFTTCLGASALAGVPSLGLAQAKVLKILVGFAAGGGADMVARAVGEGLRDSGYNVVVDNRAGAGGRLALEALAREPADGSTLVLTPEGALTLYPHVYKALRYDPLKQFAGVATACRMGFALAVAANSPVRTLQDFLAQARRTPTLGAYGTAGAGSTMHLIGALLGKQAKVPLTHVPYKGAAQAVTDAIGGAVPAVIAFMPFLLAHHKADKLRILAISDATPNPALPGVPTFKSLGYSDLVITDHFAFFAPAGTPAPVIARLGQAISKAVRSPKVSGMLQKADYDVVTMAPDALDKHVRAEHAQWGAIVKAVGYTPEE